MTLVVANTSDSRARLARRSQFVPPPGPELELFLATMRLLVKKHHGYAIAGVQAGRLWRVALTEWGDVWIDPRMLRIGRRTVEEGCLSLPGRYVTRTRARRVLGLWRDEEHRWHVRLMKGTMAQAFEHERDHMDGRTIA